MTTIAYNKGIIAVDSRCTSANTIITDKSKKIYKRQGVVFVTCGAANDAQELIKAYFGESYNIKADVAAIIDDNGEVYAASIDENDGFWKYKTTEHPYTMGTGGDHALTAIDMGCSAREAVRMAMKRDCKTGGDIITHRVKTTKSKRRP